VTLLVALRVEGGRGDLCVPCNNGPQLNSPSGSPTGRSQVRSEAQLLSPFGSWQLTGPWTQGFTLDPGAETAVRYKLDAAANARPGAHWQALVKVMYFGRLRYTEAIPLSVSDMHGR
jgi:hypothetical protein